MSFFAAAPIDPGTWFQYFFSLLMLTLFFFLSRGEMKRRKEMKSLPEEEEEEGDLHEEDEFDDEGEEDEEEEVYAKPLPPLKFPIKKKLTSYDNRNSEPIFHERKKSEIIFHESGKTEHTFVDKKLKKELEALYGPLDTSLASIESAYTDEPDFYSSRAEKALKGIKGHLATLFIANEVIGKPRSEKPHDYL